MRRAVLAAIAVASLLSGAAIAGARAAKPVVVATLDDVRRVFPDLRNAACPLPGVASGGQPDSAGLAAAAAAGYRSVLDARGPDEPRGIDEPRLARSLGLEYVALPVTPETLGDRTFDRFRHFMKQPRLRPMLLHCATGNRTAILLVPHLVLDRGLAPDSALAIARAAGMRDGPMVEQALDYVRRKSRR